MWKAHLFWEYLLHEAAKRDFIMNLCLKFVQKFQLFYL